MKLLKSDDAPAHDNAISAKARPRRGRALAEIARRAGTLWRVKALMFFVLTPAFLVPYLYLAHHAFFPVRQVPVTWIDRAIPFDSRWAWGYQSLYLLNCSIPLLATTRDALRRYAVGFALMSGTCFVVYVFFPTCIVAQPLESTHALYRLVREYDGPHNALPSLHLAFVYFTLAFGRRVWGPVQAWVWIGMTGWALLITYSTLATKQHYALDLPAGVLTGAVADWAAWRSARPIRGVTSQSGCK